MLLPLLLRRLQLLLLRRIRGATGVGHLRLLLQRLVRRGALRQRHRSHYLRLLPHLWLLLSHLVALLQRLLLRRFCRA